MKEVYNYRCLVSFDGGKEFHDTSIWNHMRYLEEKDAQEWQSKELTFDECYEMCENGFLMNGEAWVGMFKKRKVAISTVEWECKRTYNEKNYRPVIIKEVYLKEEKSMKALADLLTAEEFIEYLKDRGMNCCPNLK